MRSLKRAKDTNAEPRLGRRVRKSETVSTDVQSRCSADARYPLGPVAVLHKLTSILNEWRSTGDGPRPLSSDEYEALLCAAGNEKHLKYSSVENLLFMDAWMRRMALGERGWARLVGLILGVDDLACRAYGNADPSTRLTDSASHPVPNALLNVLSLSSRGAGEGLEHEQPPAGRFESGDDCVKQLARYCRCLLVEFPSWKLDDIIQKVEASVRHQPGSFTQREIVWMMVRLEHELSSDKQKSAGATTCS